MILKYQTSKILKAMFSVKQQRLKKNLISSEIDPLRYINNILGKSVGEIIEKTVTSNNELLTDNFRPDSFFSLKRWDSSIKAAFLGIYGGRWFSRPFGVYFNNKPDRYCGFRNKSEYSKIKENPISLMLPEHLTLSRAPFFITTAMGIDSGEILPPYPPLWKEPGWYLDSSNACFKPEYLCIPYTTGNLS